MNTETLAYVGAIITAIGGSIYLYETLKGKIQPNRITWLLWGMFPMITFAAQRSVEAETVAWISFSAGLLPLLIFVASFVNKNAYWHTRPTDYVCMALALIGVVLWLTANNPTIAIIFALMADFFAGAPTLLKAYKHPESESWRAYATDAVGFGLGVVSVQSWTFHNYSFTLYLFVMSLTLTILSLRARNHSSATASPDTPMAT